MADKPRPVRPGPNVRGVYPPALDHVDDNGVHQALRAPRFMLTFGDEYGRALRITLGRLSRRGRWHGWQPCMFWLMDNRRVGGE